jgi:aminoglycoside phosphotransferase (APT) family kinase protein
MSSDPLLERLQRAVSPDYRAERVLGGGGMGVVYLAHEVMLNRAVAIKVLRPEIATAAAEAFLREARILASVRHPNIIAIYRPGEGEGLQYYVMELVNGPTLEDRLETGAVDRFAIVRDDRDADARPRAGADPPRPRDDTGARAPQARRAARSYRARCCGRHNLIEQAVRRYAARARAVGTPDVFR